MTAWTTPATWLANQIVSATDLNTQIRDNENHLSEQISRTGWAAFTPTVNNLTVGTGGTVTGKIAYAGKTAFFYVEAVLGSSGFSVGALSVNFPETAVTYQVNHPVGWVALYDSSPVATYHGVLAWGSTTVANIAALSVSGSYIVWSGLSSTIPITWAAGDKVLIHAVYERA